MNAKKRKSLLSGVPSLALAFLSLIAQFILFFVLVFLGELLKIDENIGDPIVYTFFAIYISTCCYLIVRQNPNSIWYVPIICNVVGIITAVVESNFWITPLGIFIGGGIVMSVMASIIGYVVGRRRVKVKLTE